MDFDFLANTTGTPNSSPAIAAIPIPEDSIVKILFILCEANFDLNSLAISKKSSTSIWWFKKESTFTTLPSLITPSFLIRSSNNFMKILSF